MGESSSSSYTSLTELSAVETAAWLVEDAMVGEFDENFEQTKTAFARKHYLRFENAVYPERFVAVAVLCLMSFVEVPLWCLGQRTGTWTWQNGHTLCRTPGHSYLSGIDYFPVGATVLVEAVCLAYLAYLLALEVGFKKQRMVRFKLRTAVTCLYVADLAVFAGLVFVGGGSPWFRLGPYCRAALFVVTFNSVFQSAEAGVALLGPFFNVAILLLLAIGFAGWLGAVTFDDYRFENHEGAMANEGFETFHDALYTIFFVSTTANFPDQMLPMYTTKRIFGLFFFFYVLIAVFVFLNLILATVYNEYSDFMKQKVVAASTNRARGLAAAFKLVATVVPTTNDKVLTKADFAALVEQTSKVDRVPTVDKKSLDFFFSVMDDDRSGTISGKEFYDICDILQYSFKVVSVRSLVQRRFPNFARESKAFKDLEAAVQGRHWDDAVTAALVLNTLVILFQSWLDLANVPSAGSILWAYVDLLFSVFYMTMLTLELAVKSFDEFWLSPSNRFDLVVTTTLFVISLLWALPFAHVGRELMHYLTILRLLRLLNLIAAIDRFSLIAECIAKIIPASGGVVGLLYASASLWSAAGSQAFGGLIYDDNAALDPDCDYLTANYAILNFNDYAMGFMPLFAMITSGGPYTEFVEAFDHVAEFKGAGVVFFFSWYVVGNLIMVNVFSAFVIDAFLSQYTGQALAQDAEAESLDQSNVQEGYRIVAQRGSTTEDVYRAMFADDLDETTNNDD